MLCAPLLCQQNHTFGVSLDRIHTHLMLYCTSRVTAHTVYAFSYVSINFSVIRHKLVTFHHIRSRLTSNAWFCQQSEGSHSLCIFMCFYQFHCCTTQTSHFSSESMQTRPKRSVAEEESRRTQYMHFHVFLSVSVLLGPNLSVFIRIDADSSKTLCFSSRVKAHTVYAFSCVSINFSDIGHKIVTFHQN